MIPEPRLPKKEEVAEILQLEKFKGWVAAMPPTTLVGMTNSIYSCPIARFLKGNLKLNYDVHVATSSAILIDPAGWRETYELPYWASRFIMAFDRTTPEKLWKYAEDTLVILKLVEEGLNEVGKDAVAKGKG